MGHNVTETTSSTGLLQLFVALKVKTGTNNGTRKKKHAKKKGSVENSTHYKGVYV
jgi:hypothetical protein